ncbi:MAG TPA: DegT/DnrJ/EryC1/StrS family aminotransferase, partial [Thermoanaerobaculales bacterium]|nr:DegT/DnrJ/EryC1/StrS family aminotransferase [Thermoanaerobaculales bacterium]
MFASDLAAYARCTDHLDGTGIVATLEREIATITGFPYVLSMSSASTALTAAYDAMALVPGDEVIAPALAAAEAVGPL